MSDLFLKGSEETSYATTTRAENIINAAKKIMRKKNLKKAREMIKKKREFKKKKQLEKEKEEEEKFLLELINE